MDNDKRGQFSLKLIQKCPVCNHDYLEGKIIGKEELIEVLQSKIHGYARRQITWFKKTPNARWIKNYGEAVALIKDYDIP